MRPLLPAELEAGLTTILQSPKDSGVLRLIVRRPEIGVREVVTEAQVDPLQGLVGDRWWGGGRRASARLETQLNIMNARVIALVAQSEERWPLAGDQLYVDFDLSTSNLPVGAQLAIGSALVEVTARPHLGCAKFAARFGADAMEFVNSSVGTELRLRGLNARVVQGGRIRVGDVVKKVA
jgi:hypothetical protein